MNFIEFYDVVDQVWLQVRIDKIYCIEQRLDQQTKKPIGSYIHLAVPNHEMNCLCVEETEEEIFTMMGFKEV